jgi:predicted butyrate kinase (DUF1464 family)
MRTATLTTQTLQRLNILTELIRKNIASVDDYNEYESILINSGAFTHPEIHDYLRRANLHSYATLIQARNQAKTIQDKKIVEGVAVVGLVALGLALIFSSSKK